MNDLIALDGLFIYLHNPDPPVVIDTEIVVERECIMWTEMLVE
tara:strand:+ start:450 stop:578 length:129 start_codon:yes stop_codon:yes gene_type:complete